MDREKVARAIGDCLHGCGKFNAPYDEDDWTKGPSLLAADAAIQAVMEQLREPTGKMRAAGALAGDWNEHLGPHEDRDYAAIVWQAMLSAFLQNSESLTQGRGQEPEPSG